MGKIGYLVEGLESTVSEFYLEDELPSYLGLEHTYSIKRIVYFEVEDAG